MTRDQEDLGEANIRIMKPFECKILMMIKHKLSSEIRESSANDRWIMRWIWFKILERNHKYKLSIWDKDRTNISRHVLKISQTRWEWIILKPIHSTLIWIADFYFYVNNDIDSLNHSFWWIMNPSLIPGSEAVLAAWFRLWEREIGDRRPRRPGHSLRIRCWPQSAAAAPAVNIRDSSVSVWHTCGQCELNEES